MTERFRVVQRTLLVAGGVCVVEKPLSGWRLTRVSAAEEIVGVTGVHPLHYAIAKARLNEEPWMWARMVGPDVYMQRSPWPPHPSGWAVLWRMIWGRRRHAD